MGVAYCSGVLRSRTLSDLACCGQMQTKSCLGSQTYWKRASESQLLDLARVQGPSQSHGFRPKQTNSTASVAELEVLAEAPQAPTPISGRRTKGRVRLAGLRQDGANGSESDRQKDRWKALPR